MSKDSHQEESAQGLENAQRLDALYGTNLLDSAPEAAFDRFTQLAHKIIGTPVALISLVDQNRQFFKSYVGLSGPYADARETPLTHSFCQHVVTSGEPLIIADAREYPLVQNNLAVKDLGVIAYAGIPLTTSSGLTLGSFCAIDTQPHAWTPYEIDILKDLAALIMTEIELRLTTKQLQASYDRLKELETLRNDLVQMIVHDLRTPLNSLLGGLQIIKAEGDLNEIQELSLAIALRSGGTLNGMITDMLDINKMEAGQSTLEYQETTTTQLVESAVQQVAQLAEKNSQCLTSHIAPAVASLTFRADAQKLSRTLVNLLGNAIKFTPDGGQINLSVELYHEPHTAPATDGETLLFSISDTGIGIPKEAFETIFEKFAQVKANQAEVRAQARSSTGLGLTFCKMVVEAHGGRIWVESELGKGSTFRFTIPRYPKQ
ncbi:MAG: GAF domain-containing sensor histidine kinase [Abitibacteriaceae bacterium]|nr:GAF domain-containing sensor histidine kinase [Abditibacteriaceae bacterium]MBV9866961.1 GAF domain-containing sensor histidine kinase [Abditibacteriaceae bacterium]